MQIVLVRHGETEWSLSGQHTSRTDLPLIDAGVERARAIGPVLAGWDFSLVLTSPLRRARETCELAGFGDRAQVLEDLREWDYGEYEGLTTPQIREQRPGWYLWRDGCPGGESADDVGRRVDRVIAEALEAPGDVALVAHGHVLRALAGRWLEQRASFGGRLRLDTGT